MEVPKLNLGGNSLALLAFVFIVALVVYAFRPDNSTLAGIANGLMLGLLAHLPGGAGSSKTE